MRAVQAASKHSDTVTVDPQSWVNTWSPFKIPKSKVIPWENGVPKMASSMQLVCPKCNGLFMVGSDAFGKTVTCSHCKTTVAIPNHAQQSPPNAGVAKKDGLFGIAGLILEIVFCVGIVVAAGSFEAVMLGGILSLAGLVLSILGIALDRGRGAGLGGICVFVVAWALNTMIIGRL